MKRLCHWQWDNRKVIQIVWCFWHFSVFKHIFAVFFLLKSLLIDIKSANTLKWKCITHESSISWQRNSQFTDVSVTLCEKKPWCIRHTIWVSSWSYRWYIFFRNTAEKTKARIKADLWFWIIHNKAFESICDNDNINRKKKLQNEINRAHAPTSIYIHILIAMSYILNNITDRRHTHSQKVNYKCECYKSK